MPNALCLENPSLRLSWGDNVLRAENRISGVTTVFDFPAFLIRLGWVEIPPNRFSLVSTDAGEDEVTFSYRHDATETEVDVHYWLEGDRPWFKKSLSLRAPESVPTPDRLWIDVQPNPPGPVRRVGFGVRGGPETEEQKGLDTYSKQPGCGYPVWAGDWFIGVEHPVGFTVPGRGLVLYQHPVWNADRTIDSYAAVYGVATCHDDVPAAFEDYLWQIRLPRLEKPIVHISLGWSTRYLGNREYIDSFEANEAFADAIVDLGLRPDCLAMDAGWFDRRSVYRHKADDEKDTRLLAFRKRLDDQGLGLALWVTHNGPVGFDTDWIQEQGWRVGEGPGSYDSGTFVVMAQPDFEEAVAARWERLVDAVDVSHLKIDWDNDCATHPDFAERYPTPDHMREASINAFNRIDRRLRAANLNLVTRNGWWPSPWWLSWANHVWLARSGDCEYASWPSRTQRDRALTHRDACYYQIMRRSETPVPLDVFDNHEFVQALTNAFGDESHTWLDNLVLAVCRGTTYIPLPICPESLRTGRARQLQSVIDWMRGNADTLGTRGARMVLGDPADGEPYGFLHPSDGNAWLLLRNPSVEPRTVSPPLHEWLDFTPGTLRQVYPFWCNCPDPVELTLLGHEVRLLRASAEPRPDPSPIPGAPFMVQACDGGFSYAFPGNRPLADGVGPVVHPDMQIHDLSAEVTANEAREGARRLQWYAVVPHRFERPELLVTLRGPEEILDRVDVRAGGRRYKGVAPSHYFVTQRILSQDRSPHGTSSFLPPLGPRDRDDYVFSVHDGGWASLTVDIIGEGADRLAVEAWLTGYVAPARRTLTRSDSPTSGPLLPVHPYGFASCLRLDT